MVYSLVNVPTLIRDLARLPAGRALVTDLLQVFALTRPDLEVLDARGRQAGAADPLGSASFVRAQPHRPRAQSALAAPRSESDAAGASDAAARGGSVDVLAAATIGDLDDLIRFVRHDVLAAAWSAADELAIAVYPKALGVVTDGLAATYAGRADIGRTWRHWCAVHPVPPPVPYPLIVDAVRQLDPSERVVAVPAEWSQLMHEACWAVHLSGRERAAAITQLAALQALFDSTDSPAPRHGLVATVVAAVHACVGSDLLAPDVYAAMTQPFFSLLS
jgi:hypothetical protein